MSRTRSPATPRRPAGNTYRLRKPYGCGAALNGLKAVFVEAERRERNLCLLDPERLASNCFHVTDEFAFQSGPRRIRADVVFLLDGIPIIVFETKEATRLEGIAESFDQIRRYHFKLPNLMAQVQLFALTHLRPVHDQ